MVESNIRGSHLIEERVKESDAKNGLLFDGFPRTVEQANGLASLMTDLGLTLNKVLYFYSS